MSEAGFVPGDRVERHNAVREPEATTADRLSLSLIDLDQLPSSAHNHTMTLGTRVRARLMLG